VSTIAPVQIQGRFGQQPRRGQQSLFRLRAAGTGLSQETNVEVVVESGLWPGQQQKLAARLAPTETHEFSGLTFVPQHAGADEVRVTLTLKDAAGLPIGRWTGSQDVVIQESAANVAGPVQAEKGAVVIVGGSLPGLDAMANLGAVPPSWQPIPLQQHPLLRRLAAACPQSVAPPPLAADRLWQAGSFHAVITFSDQQSGQVRSLACLCGTSAVLGRGGEPAVAWWLKPAPYVQDQHVRLSRQHIVLELRGGRAWVTEKGTNRTSLNGRPVPRDEMDVLNNDDLLSPAEVVPLRVTLHAAAGKVHAVWMEREDGLAGRLRYVLTSGQAVPLPNPEGMQPGLWLAWLQGAGGGPELAIHGIEGRGWTALGPGQERQLGQRYVLRWRLLPAPQEQDQYLTT
jgi:hypothetical protein